MSFNLRNRSLLTILDLNQSELLYLLDLAHDLKRVKYSKTEQQHLKGKNIALIFEKPSTRTRCAFAHPTKPIGPIYTQTEAERLAAERGWAIAPDGDAYRRVVPSPEPRRILEMGAIQLLVQSGVLVICVGGGGIPVIVTPLGGIRGVEAVIDKDLAAALLATSLRAEALLLLTDVDAVYTDWGTSAA
ncbi:MAG: hypothetical protein HC833_01795 [Leptolyngbyaceae cyanobacterium RM1_406_9]|nr:hypothetical protein [Leptolyngbyaceae cyanobacterium RM1_406_9]